MAETEFVPLVYSWRHLGPKGVVDSNRGASEDDIRCLLLKNIQNKRIEERKREADGGF